MSLLGCNQRVAMPHSKDMGGKWLVMFHKNNSRVEICNSEDLKPGALDSVNGTTLYCLET